VSDGDRVTAPGAAGAIPERPTLVLVVDDEEQIRRVLRSILRTRRYQVVEAASGEQGLIAAIEQPPDAVILDLMLPDMSGVEVCRELRAWYSGPILILSVRSEEADKIRALDEGADDYLTKPFSAGELLARLRALLRRAANLASPPPVISVGALDVDVARRLVAVSGHPLALTPTEFDILAVLARNVDCVVTQRMILERVWGPEWAEDPQALRVHVSHLRKKLAQVAPDQRFILTEPGVGFRLTVTD
jgi:two-component system KDP operon response regulator KdpE